VTSPSTGHSIDSACGPMSQSAPFSRRHADAANGLPGTNTAVANSARQCNSFAEESKTVFLRYEDAFIDDPATLDRIAAGFSRTLSSQQRDLLFQQTRRSSIERMILALDPSETVEDGVPGHRVHTETQWHTHHVNRTGEIGRWRHTLDKAQTIEVEQRLRSWMERFGYVP